MRATQLAASLLPRANVTASVFVIINVTLYAVELILSYKLFGAQLGTLAPQVADLIGDKNAYFIYVFHQWWRLITAGFLHGGLVHILMNSWSLFILVTEAEMFYGTSRVVFTYVFSTFTGFLLSLMWSPHNASLGASAACFGYFGLMLAMAARRRADPLAQAVRSHYGQWLIFGLLLSIMPGVDLAAHVGGFIGGFLVGLVAGLPGLPGAPREFVWRTLAGLAIAASVYAFWLDALSYHALIRHLT
ncbi:MAG: rhomboid family intramembrane serine protease [Acidobacteriia bacterium]|nr:rhomboid family intramembrane serine protease [Terriglobia bacterium]